MEHYYSQHPMSPLNLRRIRAILRKVEFNFYTGSGVFSIKRVDKGTEVLINFSRIEDGWSVLDFGCGYGAVGVALAKLFPKSYITMTDINERAVKLAHMNADLNRVKNIGIFHGNMLEKIDGNFDTVLLNPPQNAGKQLCFEMIEKSHGCLKEGGLLQLIARHNKGGKGFASKMEELFGNIEVIAKKAGYWLYVSKK